MATEAMLSTFNATSTRCGVWGLGSGVWGLRCGVWGVADIYYYIHSFFLDTRTDHLVGHQPTSQALGDASWPSMSGRCAQETSTAMRCPPNAACNVVQHEGVAGAMHPRWQRALPRHVARLLAFVVRWRPHAI